MKKYIYIDKEDRHKLMEHFGVSKDVVSLALLFKRNSLLSQRIRVYALNQFDYTEIVQDR
ncbi:MAG: hypothetical protein IJR02_03175 [Bacteroidaceae bacterium]|nr:hypothetical protein [Bacteroidaceae bacterium]